MSQKPDSSKELPIRTSALQELRQRGIEYNVKLGSVSGETLEITKKADLILDSFYEENKSQIEEKLSPFQDLIHDIKIMSLNKNELDSSVKEIMRTSMHKIINQELRCLEKGAFSNTLIGDLRDSKNQQRLVIEIFNEFIRTLEICTHLKINSNLTKKILVKKYMVNPENIPYLLDKYSNSPIPKNEIIIIASSHRNPEYSIKIFLQKFKDLEEYALTKSDSERNYIYKNVLLRFARFTNPREGLDTYLENIRRAISLYTEIPAGMVTKIILSWPTDFEGKLERYRQNINLINEIYRETAAEVKIYLALKANSDQEVKEMLSEYRNLCEELISQFPEYKKFIRESSFNKSKSTVLELLRKFDAEVKKILVSPNLPEEIKNFVNPKSIIIQVGSRHGFENLSNNLEKMSKYFKALTTYFKENNPTYRNILEEYGVNIIQIERISPSKSFEENKSDFSKRLKLFEELYFKLVQKYGAYKKHSSQTGFMIFLINSLYRTNPQEYLKSEGFEI